MNNKFSIGALFRWTTLACLVLGVIQRVFREPLVYDRTTAFLAPLYDIVWLMGYENTIQWQNNTYDSISTLMFGLGCIVSVAIHVMALHVAYHLIFGWETNNVTDGNR